MNFDFAALLRNEAPLRAALAEADTAPLAMVLVQLSGDETVLDQLRPHIAGAWDFSNAIPDDLAASVRERLISTLREYAAEGRDLPAPPSPQRLRRMMSVCVGEPVADEYAPMMLEEMALESNAAKGIAWRERPGPDRLAAFKVAIIGAGMSGLCAAIRLREAGIPFEVFEKNDRVGGTWYENTYPGCGVDTPNHFYSYSFEPNHDWPHFFSKRDELQAYFERCADRFEIRPHIRFETSVTEARFDEAAAVWRLSIEDADGARTIEAPAVICAVGQLNRPQMPDIPGLERFAGPAFHTARWPKDMSLAGQRVALVGAGASAQQTVPAIAGTVAHLTVFQRSPHWVVPNPNYHRAVGPGKKWALANLPYYARWYRFTLFWAFADGIHASLQVDPDWPTPEISLNAVNDRHRQSLIRFIRKEIGDDESLLAKTIPDYPPYGKRMLIDNRWYRTLARDNVDLVTRPIAEVTEIGIVTDDGAEHPADVLVLATGFQAARMLWPMHIVGRGGESLRARWGEDDPKAYLGVTVPGFPNFFLLYGPNTNLGHGGSAIFHAECQVRYTLRCLRELLERDRASIECREAVHDAYNARVDAAHANMVWTHPGMSNWYRNKAGRVMTNSPWRLVDYWRWTAEPDPADYVFR